MEKKDCNSTTLTLLPSPNNFSCPLSNKKSTIGENKIFLLYNFFLKEKTLIFSPVKSDFI